MKEGNNNNSECKLFKLYIFVTENSRHIAMKMFMNTTLFDVQNVGNCISEDLDFLFFLGDHAPSPPRLKGLLRRFFFLLLPMPHSKPPLMLPTGKFLKPLCLVLTFKSTSICM